MGTVSYVADFPSSWFVQGSPVVMLMMMILTAPLPAFLHVVSDSLSFYCECHSLDAVERIVGPKRYVCAAGFFL